MVRTGSAAAVVAGVMLRLSRFALAGLFIEGARGGLVGRGKFPVEEVVEHVADLLDDPPDQRFLAVFVDPGLRRRRGFFRLLAFRLGGDGLSQAAQGIPGVEVLLVLKVGLAVGSLAVGLDNVLLDRSPFAGEARVRSGADVGGGSFRDLLPAGIGMTGLGRGRP